MDRISTRNTYQSALLNIMSGLKRQNTAEQEVATGKIADNLKGYGADADALTATRSLWSRIDTHINNGKMLASTLEVQDQVLGQLADAAQKARGAVAEAVATGGTEGLLTALQGFLSQAVDSLNTEYQGRHLFAGGRSDTEPAQPGVTLADLAAAPGVGGFFSNDQLEITSRIDDKLTVRTNFLADALGGPLFAALRQVAVLTEPPNPPLSGNLTPTQSSALQGMLATFDSAWNGLNEAV